LKFAILSDTHFGDDSCVLVTERNGGLGPGKKYDDFSKAAGSNNDYLILAGDIFDFSIASYDKAYKHGQFFFQQIQSDRIIKQNDDGTYGTIVYVAGNHDADIWHIIQHQRKVINRLDARGGTLPEPYEHSVAGILDDRKGSASWGFTLDKTTKKIGGGKGPYGGMFLDRITEPQTVFYFAYPNVYIVTDKESVLVTHGQYLEGFWSLVSEVTTKVAFEDLGFKTSYAAKLDIEKTVEVNYPLNQLACTGIGQAGVLTDIVQAVQKAIYDRNFCRVRTFLNRFATMISDKTKCWPLKTLLRIPIWIGKIRLLRAIQGIEKTRFNVDFPENPEVQERLMRFYHSSLLEIKDIRERNIVIPPPERIIFGHTHDPVSWNDTTSLQWPLHDVSLHNTGGWIREGGVFHGAEIFNYETDKGFSSVLIN
jgi:predicted phosphodiesterase